MRRADRQLADLERSIAGPSLSSVIGPSTAAAATAAQAATAPTAAVPPALTGPFPRGITEKEIRFGIAAPFSGASRELGRQMKLGIETAFNRVNEAGGIDGRMLKLFAADDGYEPSRTPEAMKQLYEKDQVFGIIGNVGTPTAAVAVPYSLERKMLFFGAFTGSNILRNDPPDRYVFNYRASYVRKPTLSFDTWSRYAGCSRGRSRSSRSRISTVTPGLPEYQRRFAPWARTTAPSFGSTTRETPSTWTMRSTS